MGYSLAIPVKSDELRQKFLSFMQKNFRHWYVVCGKDPSEWHGSASDPTDRVSYGDAKTSIGFDYQSGMYGFERDYIYSVTRWMAVKVGDRTVRMDVGEDDYQVVVFQEPTPYYIYDCDTNPTPVLVVTEEQEAALPDDQRQWAVDRWGVRVGPTCIDSQFMSCSGIVGKNTGLIDDMNGLGCIPKEDEARSAWMASRREIFLKYLKPEIDENIALIREEIQRLDQLWAGEV